MVDAFFNTSYTMPSIPGALLFLLFCITLEISALVNGLLIGKELSHGVFSKSKLSLITLSLHWALDGSVSSNEGIKSESKSLLHVSRIVSASYTILPSSS